MHPSRAHHARIEGFFISLLRRHLRETVTVGPDEFEDAAAELARSVQIVSRLPDALPDHPSLI